MDFANIYSYTVVQFIGIFFSAIGLSMALKKRTMMEIYSDILKSRSKTYFLGIVLLVISLIILLNSLILVGLSQTSIIAIKVLGILMFLESALYLFGTKKFFKKVLKAVKNTRIYSVLTVIYFVLGIYFVYVGFLSNMMFLSLNF